MRAYTKDDVGLVADLFARAHGSLQNALRELIKSQQACKRLRLDTNLGNFTWDEELDVGNTNLKELFAALAYGRRPNIELSHYVTFFDP